LNELLEEDDLLPCPFHRTLSAASGAQNHALIATELTPQAFDFTAAQNPFRSAHSVQNCTLKALILPRR